MKLVDIIKLIEKDYPLDLCYSWDNSGLLIGDKNFEIKKIMTTLEITKDVVAEAIENDIDLIISHHPFIFKGLKKVTTDSIKGDLIYKLIKNDISVYSAHTNFDIAKNGLNDYIMNKLDIINTKIIDKTKVEKLFKLCTYIPKNDFQSVKEELLNVNDLKIGNYEKTSFRVDGIGSFMGNEDSSPTIGEKNNLEEVKEFKFEMMIREESISKVINQLKKIHPYEEVAYDLIPLANSFDEYTFGLGKVGRLKEEYKLKDFINKIKDILKIENVRFVGNDNLKIKKVGVITGSGSEFAYKAKSMGADIFITGDLKYHEAQDAKEANINILDVGHFGSEHIFMEILKDYLEEKLDLKIVKSNTNQNPFKLY
ncbi:MAG: Nif3-like dinuclear metal center hexameric protein [Peptostreptococcaceae bacterium]|nr:Nif3-like dinuclear metal center hexameric protein [Peptostreptococcaceae bacterium]